MSELSAELSPKAYARVAGLLYLIIILAAGFGEGVVRAGALVSGEAAATAQSVRDSLQLVRLGFAADLIAFLCDTAVAVLLYVLLRPVDKTLSPQAFRPWRLRSLSSPPPSERSPSVAGSWSKALWVPPRPRPHNTRRLRP
jgi:hypothetical protein